MNPVIVDVRNPDEYAQSHVEGAINIPPEKIMAGELGPLAEVSKDAPIILYCWTGSRSNVTTHFLKSMGYTNVTNGINKDQVEARLKKLQ